MNKKKIIVLISSLLIVISIIFAMFIVVKSREKESVYNVIFDSNGGTLIQNQKIEKGNKVEKPDDPIKDGYVFLRWTYQGNTYDFNLVVVSDMTLEAEWEIQKFTIKFDSDGGNNIDDQIVEKGNKIIKPDNPTKGGYRFIYWMLEDKEYDFDKEIEEDIILKAKWEVIDVPKPNDTNYNQNNDSNIRKEIIISCTIRYWDTYNDIYGDGAVFLPEDQVIEAKLIYYRDRGYPDVVPISHIVKPQDPVFNARSDLRFQNWRIRNNDGQVFDFDNPDIRSCSQNPILILTPHWE